MTTADLYALYRRAHLEYDPVLGIARAAPGLSPIARTIVEFAVSDAQNGVFRSAADFERCLAHGSEALAALGLRAA